jgi:hypothetical protein
MTETVTPLHTPFVAGGPEKLFRVGPVTYDSERARGSMRTGGWMLSPDTEPCRGSVGVLADDTLGYAVIAEGPPGHWGVSTEISVEFCSPLPVDGSMLRSTRLADWQGVASWIEPDARSRSEANAYVSFREHPLV